MNVEQAAPLAHVYRRLTFGPYPGAVDRAVADDVTPAELIETLLERDPIPFEPPVDIDRPFDMADEAELGNSVVVEHWLDRMLSDDAAVHERMMWFWHGIFTSSAEKGTFLFLWHQLRKLHTHAMGNYRELAKELVIDATILQFLDGDGSGISSPNENLARELMELFMMGRGNYTEDDVRAGARSLSGRQINFETGEAEFFPDKGPSEPDTFLGKTMVFNADRVIDTILEHPVAAPYVVRNLWKYFIGTEPDEALVTEWAAAFVADDWEIAPLVERVVTSDAFLAAVHSRPRTGIEWLTGVHRAGGATHAVEAPLHDLGQVPYYPPNVAGWPTGASWFSSAIQFARASFLSTFEAVPPEWPDGTSAATAALHWCGIYDPTETTVQAMEELEEELGDIGDDERILLIKAALVTPEYALA